MKIQLFIIGLGVLFFFSSCSQTCDCDLLYTSGETGGLYFSKEKKEAYTGNCVKLYGSGKTHFKGKLKEGKRIYYKEYYENGDIKRDREFDANGQNKLITEWYANGQKALEEIFNEGGVISTRKGWYSNGNDSVDLAWKPDGSMSYQKEYYSNKSVKVDVQYVDNMIGEPMILKIEDNVLICEITGKNVSMDSRYCKVGSKLFYENGQTAAEIINPISAEYESATSETVYEGGDIYYGPTEKKVLKVTKQKKTFVAAYYTKEGLVYNIDADDSHKIGGLSLEVFNPKNGDFKNNFDCATSKEDLKDVKKVIDAFIKIQHAKTLINPSAYGDAYYVHFNCDEIKKHL